MDGRSYQSDNTDYKFTGKQRDTETGWDYFGARYYDVRIGRWGGVDPVNINLSLSPFNYANNCPLFYIDPDGRKIDPFGMMLNDPNNYKKLITDLQFVTGLTFKINGGYLDYEKDEKGNVKFNGGSETARNLLIDILNNSNIVSLWSREGLGSYGKSNEMNLDPNQINAFISGTSENLNKSTMGWAMTFLHEARHTKAGGSFHDPKTTDTPGEIEKPLNIARSELTTENDEWGYRATYQATDLKNGKSWIPFSAGAKNDILNNGYGPSKFSVSIDSKYKPK